MSIHISAANGEIAKTVLLPGDPLRARFMAERFLRNARLVSQTRNAFYYTGEYGDKMLTIGASGMGCPSIGIYSYELYTQYEVETIIRIGTCGAYTEELKLFDLVNAERAYSESTYAACAFGIKKNRFRHQGPAFGQINDTAGRMNLAVRSCNIHSSDVFYRDKKGIPPIARKNDCLAVEMEAFALFANARHLGKSAAVLLTVSDVIPTHQKISAGERETALLPMMELVLASV
ncbi:MAG: purine-nucleoside phosphorylase [Chitinophagaceae bacterium]